MRRGNIGILDIGGAFNLKPQNRMTPEVDTERVAAKCGKLANYGRQPQPATLFLGQEKPNISAKGGARGLHIAELHNFFKPPSEHNHGFKRRLGCRPQAATGGAATSISNKQSGDAILPAKQTLTLNAFSLKTRFQNDRIGILLDGGARSGRINDDLDIGNAFGGNIANAPLGGRITASASRLGHIEALSARRRAKHYNQA